MEMMFIGCGSAFTTKEYYQSNLLIMKNGKNFLLDIGTDARFALADLGMKATDIDAFTITHAHADHCGGMEWLAFSTKFIPNHPKPKLYGVGGLLHDVWNKTLSGGMDFIQGSFPTLNDYFDVHAIKETEGFTWEGILFKPIKTVHVMNDYKVADSYGYLIMDLETKYKVFFTGDTQFNLDDLIPGYVFADLILHECETSAFASGVHCHYNQLIKLIPEFKEKIRLYHYQPNPTQDPIKDGFLGFVQKGVVFLDLKANEKVSNIMATVVE